MAGLDASSSSGTRFQTTNVNGVSCNLQPAAIGSPIIRQLGGPISSWSYNYYTSADLGACSRFCEEHAGVWCVLAADAISGQYLCHSASAQSLPTLGPAQSAADIRSYVATAQCSNPNTTGGATPTSLYLDARIFNAPDYLARYADVRAAVGSDVNAAGQHWINYGLAEGRQGNQTFLASAYLARYADLRATFGNDYKRAAEHFVRYGAAEGRSGAPAVAPPPPQPTSACGGTRGAGAVVQQSVTSGNPGFAGVACGKMSGSVNQCFSCSARWQYASGAFNGAPDQVINCTCD